MSNDDCYECGCCECDGFCRVLNNYITEIEECNASEEDKWNNSCWNIHRDE